MADWEGLLASYAKARQSVGQAWAALAAPYEEE
jgi:glutamate-ammonia-ligase adenylyltransferase